MQNVRTLRRNVRNGEEEREKNANNNGHYVLHYALCLNQFWNYAYELIWFDLIWYDLKWFEMIWFDLIWFDMIISYTLPLNYAYDLIWFNMIWFDMIWYNLIWFDMNTSYTTSSQQFQLEMKIAKNLSKLKRCIICAPLAQCTFLCPLVMKVQEYDPYVYNFGDTKNHKN